MLSAEHYSSVKAYLDVGNMPQQPPAHDNGVDIGRDYSRRIAGAQLLEQCASGLGVTPDCPDCCR